MKKLNILEFICLYFIFSSWQELWLLGQIWYNNSEIHYVLTSYEYSRQVTIVYHLSL